MISNKEETTVNCNITAGCVQCAAKRAVEPESAIVAAGTACTTEACGPFGDPAQEGLARINFPIQEYTEGFCPSDAFVNGTLFPSLVL